MRWSGVLEGINFREFELTTSKGPVAELVQAAYQRSVGAVWSITLEPCNSKTSSKTSGEGYGELLHFLFGIFELDCHLTGLKLVTGCAVIGRSYSRAHWLIGFATLPALSGFAPCTNAPVFLVLKNDSILLEDQYLVIRQVDLIAVGASTEAKLFQVNDFRLAKEHFKATAIYKRPPSSRISRHANKPQPPKIEAAKAVPVSGNEFDSPQSKTRQQQLQLEKKQNEVPDTEAKPSDVNNLSKFKSKEQLQLEKQNTLQKAKIKTLQQVVRRNKPKPVTSPIDASGPDDSDSPSSSESYPKRQKSDTDNKNDTKTKPKKNGDTYVGPELGPERNGISAVLEERIAEQTREIHHTMKQQQDKLVELIQKTHDNEKLERDDVNKKEKEDVDGVRYRALHSEVCSLKTLLVEQEKASELKSLRQTNEMLAQTLKNRDTSDTAGRSSALNNLKEAKELMTLFQGGQTGVNNSQNGGNASQNGGNGNNHESSAAGAWSTGHGYPSNCHSAWHAGYAGHSPQWPGYPPQWPTWYSPWADQSPSPQSQQWPNGYTPQPHIVHAGQSQSHQPQSPSHQPSCQQWPTGYYPQPQTVHAGQSPSHQSPWPPGYPPQPPSYQPQTAYAGQPPSYQPGQGVEVSGNRSRSPHSKPSSVSSSAVQYSRSEIEGWDGRNVQRWLHTNGVSINDATTLTGRNGTLQDGYYLLSITQAEFMAQFPSLRSGELSLRVLWNKIDAMQQAR